MAVVRITQTRRMAVTDLTYLRAMTALLVQYIRPAAFGQWGTRAPRRRDTLEAFGLFR